MLKDYLKPAIFTGIFLVPFIPFLVSSSFFFPFITSKAFAWRIIVEIVFAAWLLLALKYPEYRPKKSLILYSVFGFIAVIGLADVFGVDRAVSFWSNFERMEGFVSLLHLGAYFLVLVSVMSEELWQKWWNTSLVASALMVGVAFFQFVGWAGISQGGARVDGTFGNPIYLAVYMLFHIFLALYFMVREWGNKSLRFTYGALIVFQLFVLYHTATRGAILGLIGGVLILGLLNLKGAGSRMGKKVAIWALTGSLVLVGGLYLARNTGVVSQSPVLSRFTSLSLEELKTQGRYFVWPIAWAGFTERPLLGWGQENFGRVFEKHYVPEMYHLEPWFDRAHNIFLDWLVSGGVLGLLSYLALYVLALYAIWWRSAGITFADKSIVTALLAAYFFHNFFVFDHLISYILFFSLLAYIHSHATSEAPVSWEKPVDETWVKISVPVVAILLVSVIYSANLKPMMNNMSIIEAMMAKELGQPALVAENLKEAFNDVRLGRIEIAEQIVSNSMYVLQSDVSVPEKNELFEFVSRSISTVASESENDARIQLFTGSFFTVTGQFEESEKYLLRASELVPGKQAVYLALGVLYLNWEKNKEALERFQQAYDMAPEYREAQISYLTAAIYTGERALEQKLVSELDPQSVIFDDRILSAYFESGRTAEVRYLLNQRLELDPANAEGYQKILESL